ncbi:MAG TPA: PEP-CTERM sorting domain-containing protein [Pyrinomonadaceae bacterium]|jgi:hypothetical protein|nr:PEP-CTERM sorting domain-containing protein [Pyrinomonadaceae bacterium]
MNEPTLILLLGAGLMLCASRVRRWRGGDA